MLRKSGTWRQYFEAVEEGRRALAAERARNAEEASRPQEEPLPLPECLTCDECGESHDDCCCVAFVREPFTN